MTNKILCSTGAITSRRNGYDYTLLEKLAEELECDGFELMIDSVWYGKREQLKAYLKEKAFYIPVVHCEKEIGELISRGSEEEQKQAFYEFEMDCDIAKAIGAKKLVLHLWGGMASDGHFQRNIEAYPKLNKIAQEYGLRLMIENVVCNVEDPMKHLCELRELYPDICFVFDTKMAAFHGQLELLYEPKYTWLWEDKYIEHYHVNDYAGGYKDWPNLRTLPVGKGKLDLKRFLQFVNKTGYEGYFTAEGNAQLGDGMVDVETLNQQFRKMKEFLGEIEKNRKA
ncbi:MAG: sugar phosphate isomerase/epimerase [Lachnospiraceae bacterium]|nr:sugar phosphate isomerase/epimerase [Lachnospiraceae bacterium]